MIKNSGKIKNKRSNEELDATECDGNKV